jgi:hypothetical protein
MSTQLTIPLTAKADKNGDEYFIGSVDLAAAVDLSKVTFLFFPPAKDEDMVGYLKVRPRGPDQRRRDSNE